MRSRNTSLVLRWVSLAFILGAAALTTVQLVGYSRARAYYPAGMTIAGVPVGRLDPQTASQRVVQIYSLPIEVQYGEASFQIDPSAIGFQLDIEAMLAAADLQRTGSSFWGGFWDYLWNRTPAAQSIPLRYTLSEDRLRQYLATEISTRYDEPPTPAQPIPGTTSFIPGKPGRTLDIDRAVILIEDALRSPNRRSVVLSFQRASAERLPMQNLEILLQQIIRNNDYDGVIGIYLLDLQTRQEIHFALNQGEPISVQPDVAFTASSTIKIPIMVSYFIRFGQPDEETSNLILDMIRVSENPPADRLMAAIDETSGPLRVTQDIQAAGLENTFIAGYFEPGAPLLQRFRTPANQRTDIYTDPDPYNQTSSSDMGMLLADLYQCAKTGGGGLIAAFPDKLNQAACQQMINFLAQNRIGVLIEAGVPEGTQVAHKHGWVTDVTGVIHNISDAGIVYTSGGDYVLVIYSYHPVQAIWDSVSGMFAQLSQATYNYFNLPTR